MFLTPKEPVRFALSAHASQREMKEKTIKRTKDGMRVEYDFSKGVRGKYAGKDIRIIGARQTNPPAKLQIAICVDNKGYELSLERRKVYQVLPDKKAGMDDCVRVIDETGEDYLFPANLFVVLTVPRKVEKAVLTNFNSTLV